MTIEAVRPSSLPTMRSYQPVFELDCVVCGAMYPLTRERIQGKLRKVSCCSPEHQHDFDGLLDQLSASTGLSTKMLAKRVTDAPQRVEVFMRAKHHLRTWAAAPRPLSEEEIRERSARRASQTLSQLQQMAAAEQVRRQSCVAPQARPLQAKHTGPLNTDWRHLQRSGHSPMTIQCPCGHLHVVSQDRQDLLVHRVVVLDIERSQLREQAQRMAALEATRAQNCPRPDKRVYLPEDRASAEAHLESLRRARGAFDAVVYLCEYPDTGCGGLHVGKSRDALRKRIKTRLHRH